VKVAQDSIHLQCRAHRYRLIAPQLFLLDRLSNRALDLALRGDAEVLQERVAR